MSEQGSAESLIEQYEVGDETSVVETPAETATPPSVETAPVPRDDKGRFVSQSTPESPHSPAPAYLVRMAKHAGFTDEEIQGIPPEALGLAVAAVHERRREDVVERTHHEAADKARQGAASPPVPPQADEPFELPAEEYDDKLLNVLKRQDKELKTLRQEIAQLRNVEVSRQNETLTQKIDRLFDESKADDRFGKGPGKKLAKDSPEMKRRLAVLREMETLGPGDIEENFEKAVTTLYGAAPKPKPAPEKELEARKEEWNRSGVARPTHRVGAPEQNGRGKAISAVEAKLKEMGAAGQDDTTSPDEFLGE